jgi:hypothetical protein
VFSLIQGDGGRTSSDAPYEDAVEAPNDTPDDTPVRPPEDRDFSAPDLSLFQEGSTLGAATIDGTAFGSTSGERIDIQASAGLGGTEHTSVLRFRVRANRDASLWSNAAIGGEYELLSATIGRFTGVPNSSAVFTFIGDGEELATYNLGANDPPFEILLDVRGVQNLRIEAAVSRPVPMDGALQQIGIAGRFYR